MTSKLASPDSSSLLSSQTTVSAVKHTVFSSSFSIISSWLLACVFVGLASCVLSFSMASVANSHLFSHSLLEMFDTSTTTVPSLPIDGDFDSPASFTFLKNLSLEVSLKRDIAKVSGNEVHFSYSGEASSRDIREEDTEPTTTSLNDSLSPLIGSGFGILHGVISGASTELVLLDEFLTFDTSVVALDCFLLLVFFATGAVKNDVKEVCFLESFPIFGVEFLEYFFPFSTGINSFSPFGVTFDLTPTVLSGVSCPD